MIATQVARDHGISRADAYTLAGVVAIAHMGVHVSKHTLHMRELTPSFQTF